MGDSKWQIGHLFWLSGGARLRLFSPSHHVFFFEPSRTGLSVVSRVSNGGLFFLFCCYVLLFAETFFCHLLLDSAFKIYFTIPDDLVSSLSLIFISFLYILDFLWCCFPPLRHSIRYVSLVLVFCFFIIVSCLLAVVSFFPFPTLCWNSLSVFSCLTVVEAS